MRKLPLIFALIFWFMASPQALSLTPEQVNTLSSGAVVSEIEKGEKGMINVFGAVDIAAAPMTIWRLMQDCDAQLDIIPDLKSCKVLEEAADKTWDIRQQIVKLGFPLPNVRSEFRSDYDPWKKITISRTGGDLSHSEGIWVLEVLPSDHTRVTYKASMKSRLPVPANLIRRGVKKDMPLILQNLRRQAEALQKDPSSLTTP